jgi:hypothetical protein
LQALADKYGVSIDVMEQAFEVEGIKGILDHKIARKPIQRMDGVPLAKVLRTVLSRIEVPSGVTFYVNCDHILITTRMYAAIDSWTCARAQARPLVSAVGQPLRAAVLVDLDDVDYHASQAAALFVKMGYWHGVMVDNVPKLPHATIPRC